MGSVRLLCEVQHTSKVGSCIRDHHGNWFRDAY